VVITPSHNPPEDGGFKYNPPHGGPAGDDITQWIAKRANQILGDGPGRIKRMPFEKALRAATTYEYDYISPYVADAPATVEQKEVLNQLLAEAITTKELTGEPIIAKHTRAPGNQAPLGGLKVVTENGWFAARPSGTEEIYKIYAESFKGKAHLQSIQQEAQTIVSAAFQAAGA